MFVLYEHASGYVLVHCEQTDDISELNANDYASFGQLVKLKAFQPFTSAAIALDNMNAISEGNVLREKFDNTLFNQVSSTLT